MLMSRSSHLEPYLCAWCNCKLGFGSAKIRGVPATNYGMCADCLAVQLARPLLRPSQPPVAVPSA